MINTDQGNYIQVLSDVTKHLSLILKQSNDLNKDSLNWSPDFLNKSEIKPEQLTIKKVILSKELNQVNDKEPVIYDEVSDLYDQLNSCVNEKPVVYIKKHRTISLNERLKKTQTIWFLPNLNSKAIINSLQNKQIGNFILTNGFQKTDLIENLNLFVLVENNTTNEFSIEYKNKKFYLKNQSSYKFDAIIPLLEYFLAERPITGNLKLTLPNPISNAISLQQLYSLSLLEQDFWLKDFSNCTKRDKIELNATTTKNKSTAIDSIYSFTPFISTTTTTNSNNKSFRSNNITIKQLNTESKQISFSSSLIQIPVASRKSQLDNSKYVRKSIKNSQTQLDSKTNNCQLEVVKQPSTKLSLIVSSKSFVKKRFHSKSLDQLNSFKKNIKSPIKNKYSTKTFIQEEEELHEEKGPTESSSSLLPSSSISFKSSSTASFKSFNSSTNTATPTTTTPTTEDLISVKQSNKFQWPHKYLLKKKFRSNLTIGLSDKDLDTDLNKRQSVKSNTRSITDFFIGLINKNKSNLEETLFKEPELKKIKNPKKSFLNNLIKRNKSLKLNNSDNTMIIDRKQFTENAPKLPFTAPPSLKSNKTKILEEHYSSSSMFYSSFPVIRTQQQDLSKSKKMDRFSNEYSEPFDFLLNDKLKSAQSTLTKLNQTNKDDSAYSSSYVSQSSQSTPRIYNNIWETGSLSTKPNSHTSSDDTNMFDTSIINSSSSSSSTNENLFKHSTPLLLNKKSNKKTEMPIVSEYESVKDSLIKYERRLDLQNSFKSTITAFDVLSDRCAELIGLFDSDNESSSFKSKAKMDKKPSMTRFDHENNLIITKCKQEAKQKANSTLIASVESKYMNNSRFLDRTLSFNNFMSSSVLLTSFNDLIYSDHYHETNGTKANFNSIRSFIFRLAKNGKSIFGKSINEFITCSVVTKELNPNVLMSNTRQFMNGMKNYLMNKNDLINNDLKFLIEKERENLDSTEIINIDWILEDCLQSIVLRPLKAKIYYLIVDYLINDGSLVAMNKNIKYLNSLNDLKCIEYLTLAKMEHKPSNETLNLLRDYYNRMQCEYAPLIKLKYILYMINELLSSSSDSLDSLNNNNFFLALQDLSFLNVVEFLPIVIYSLCKCNMSAIQIEIDYIWSLVNKQLLNNECIYYLTLMSSACFVLKNFDSNQIEMKTLETSQKLVKLKQMNLISSLQNLSYMESGLIEIYLIDNFKTVQIKTIPVKPNSKCKEVNSLIASKFKIFNCEEYALYFIENGVEKKLRDDDQPLEIKINRIKAGIHVKFIYKQKLANIVTKYY